MQAHLCAAATMVWQDYTFLEKWIDYYGAGFQKPTFMSFCIG